MILNQAKVSCLCQPRDLAFFGIAVQATSHCLETHWEFWSGLGCQSSSASPPPIPLTFETSCAYDAHCSLKFSLRFCLFCIACWSNHSTWHPPFWALYPTFCRSHLQRILVIPARYSRPVASVISGLYCTVTEWIYSRHEIQFIFKCI